MTRNEALQEVIHLIEQEQKYIKDTPVFSGHTLKLLQNHYDELRNHIEDLNDLTEWEISMIHEGLQLRVEALKQEFKKEIPPYPSALQWMFTRQKDTIDMMLKLQARFKRDKS